MIERANEFLQRSIHELVKIVRYRSEWPECFEREKKRLSGLFPALVAIEHFGSTAVPGLAAKPIIDILAAVSSIEVADGLIQPLCENGYVTSAEFNATLIDHRWLMRQEEGRRTHHLHLVIENGIEWKKKLYFRDVLRRNSQIARDYTALKYKLAEAIGTDREQYTTAKTQFVESILANCN